MDTMQMDQIVKEYCKDEMQKLKEICDPMIHKKGVPQMEYDDLYSDAQRVLLESVESYDASRNCSFQTFLIGNIQRSFYDWTRDRMRAKRCNVQMDQDGNIMRDEKNREIVISNVSLDASMENGMELCEILASDFNIEDEVCAELGFSCDERIEQYLDSLSNIQRRIAEMIMEGYKPSEIRRKAGLTRKQYTEALRDMKAFEKSRVLRHVEQDQTKEEKQMKKTAITQTLEKSKSDRLSIAAILKKIDNYTIRFDHPLQRASEQWSPAMKGNLISDILQRNPIPPLVFAEQIVNGIAVIWDLDGKQRCTNVYAFKNDCYRITKNIRRWNIYYQAMIRDEQGRPLLDKDGFPRSERKECDIRGKKFSELPDELKDRLLDYNFEIVQYLNCSGDDIAYHIARYNEGKPMSAAQKGLTRLGEDFAAIVKSISAMPFFKNQGGYKVSESNNGTVNRVVVESVMAANFLDNWKKKQEDMCAFIKENATVEMFERFENMVDRISKAGTEEVFDMFDSKDSFLYFGLFARFINTGLEDARFIEFMTAFRRLLHSKKMAGVSYDDLNGKSTKDKNVVVNKINYLEKLMLDYFKIKA